ncbi:LysR substrate-binding domain-containing protein [Pseudooctadecabacter sp.]|uniref:LysR family transcriptional regulator n=1 Tax=Pseudooctadecabacter sp. TaxID=1966338 RepID=UPI0035C7F644
MDEYRALAVFVAVHEAGSFSGAGRRLKLSTSVISHHVSRLEDKVGASLFFRSTRSLSLTPEGRAILTSARAMVKAADDAFDILTETSDQPTGSLRVTLPAFGDRSPLHQSLMRFVRAHPLVSMSIHTSDFPVDLVKEGFDLAIRLGVLRDSAMMRKRIGSFGRKLVASPAYVAGRPPIRTLEDLQACNFISIAMLPAAFTLVRQDQQFTFEPENLRLEVHSLSSAKLAILEGLGIQHLPDSEADAEIADGRLVEILPEWSLPELGIYAVWPDLGPQKKLTRRLIQYLGDADL